MLPPFWRQVSILSSVVFAGLSIGGSIGISTVLIKQFQEPDSPIKLDLEYITWIGSVSGMAGILNVLIPGFMQAKGRKTAFIFCVTTELIAWLLTYFGSTLEIILMAMCFHGFGTQSVSYVSVLVISEIATPKYRNFWYNLFVIGSVFATFLVHFLGIYANWKNVALVFCAPSTLSLLITCFWTESPAWLAWKGRFDECEKVFTAIREADENSHDELQKLMQCEVEQSHVDNEANSMNEKILKKVNVWRIFQSLWQQVKIRDFYYPMFLIGTCVFIYAWTGILVLRIYVNEMSKQTDAFDCLAGQGSTILDLIILIGVILFTSCLFKLNNRSLFVYSVLASGILLFVTSIGLLLIEYGLLNKKSYVPLLTMGLYILAGSIGLLSLPIRIIGDLMPVKHRGLGGIVYFFLNCFFSASILKIAPYLHTYLGLPVSFLIYDLVICYGYFVLVKYLPETKDKTLLEIENFYNGIDKRKYVGDVHYDAVTNSNLLQTKSDNIKLPLITVR